MPAAVADPIRRSSTSTSRFIVTRRSSRPLAAEPLAPLPFGKAALRRAGDDLAIILYGAYVHVASRAAVALAADGIEASVLRPSHVVTARSAGSPRCRPSLFNWVYIVH